MDLLAGVHVISFNHFLLGPVGTQVIADLGADVIKLERPGVGDAALVEAGDDSATVIRQTHCIPNGSGI